MQTKPVPVYRGKTPEDYHRLGLSAEHVAPCESVSVASAFGNCLLAV